MKMTIYLPDELGERAKAEDGLNVSAICQRALEEELVQRETLRGLGEFERIVVHVSLQQEPRDVAFYGIPLGRVDDQTAYRTQRGRIAVYDGLNEDLESFDTLDDLVEHYSPLAEAEAQLVAIVARAIGERFVEELDI